MVAVGGGTVQPPEGSKGSGDLLNGVMTGDFPAEQLHLPQFTQYKIGEVSVLRFEID